MSKATDYAGTAAEHRGSGDRAPSPADQAFGAAVRFIDDLGTLAWDARRHQGSSARSDEWKSRAGTYARASIAWHDLSKLLTPAIRDAARRVYSPGAPSIKVGQLRAKPTVIEAVADELGVYFRNVLYQDRESPLDAEGVKRWRDAFMLMASEWEGQDPTRAESRLEMLRCGSIDFDDLRTQLDREARAVLALETDLEPATIAVPADTLAKLEALATLPDTGPGAPQDDLIDCSGATRRWQRSKSWWRTQCSTGALQVQGRGRNNAYLFRTADATSLASKLAIALR